MPRRALIGPWGHNDPVHGNPGPAVGILSEFVRWWDRWLKGIENGIDAEPMVVAWMQDSVPPAPTWSSDRGGGWPSSGGRHRCVRPLTLALGDGELGEPARRGHAQHRQRPDGRPRRRRLVCRRPLGRSAGRPGGRRRPLAHVHAARRSPSRSRSWASRVVAPRVSSDRPVAMISVRLCELRADGSSLMVTRAQLNLCHRDSHEHPALLEPGQEYPVSLNARLDRPSIRGRAAASGSRSRRATGRWRGRRPSR